jgi:hypothetical protein
MNDIVVVAAVAAARLVVRSSLLWKGTVNVVIGVIAIYIILLFKIGT